MRLVQHDAHVRAAIVRHDIFLPNATLARIGLADSSDHELDMVSWHDVAAEWDLDRETAEALLAEARSYLEPLEPPPARRCTPTITFARFRDAPKVYEAAADGTVLEAGVVYEFDVFEDGDVRLWLDDRRIRSAHKLALRAAVLGAYRASPSGVLAALSAAIDNAEALS